jgi:hypothetical protein
VRAAWNHNTLSLRDTIYPMMNCNPLFLPSRLVHLLFLNELHDGRRSITVHVNNNETLGIQLRSGFDGLVGRSKRLSLAFTYYFQPGETVESFHLLTRGSNRSEIKAGPFVVVSPSSARSLMNHF